MDLPQILTPHTVTVEAYAGTGTQGPTYALPVTTRAYVEDKRRLVPGPGGDQVVSSTTVYLPLSGLAAIPAQSRVTVNGAARTVVAATRYEHSSPTPNHWEVLLQ